MQKQAPTLGRLLTMVLFALSCFGLLLFLWVAFGGPTPLKPKGYRFKVAVPEATQLGLEADVRVAGVSVGKVRAKDIDPKQPNRTIATVELNRRFAPLPQDSRAILRQKTLLGETYLEITPGNPKGPMVKEGGFLPRARVQGSTQLDEIFQALDPKTRHSFQQWQQDLAKAVNGRGQDLNDAFGNLPQFSADATDVLDVLNTQDAAVRRLFRNTGTVFSALTQNEAQLRNLITNSSRVFNATSSRQDALAETFKIFPTFLDESKRTFARLQTFSRKTDPLIQDLRPVAVDLKPTLRDARALAPDLESFFRNLDPLITASQTGLPALRDVLDGARPLLGSLQPFLQQLNPILEWLEYHQRTTADFISNGAGALADTTDTITPEERGHYLRQFGVNGAQSAAMYPERDAGNRGNAYLPPAALSGEKRARFMMFPNHDCDTAGGEHMTKIPNTTDKPSCWVQAVPQVPAGNTHKAPHIEAADYSAAAK